MGTRRTGLMVAVCATALACTGAADASAAKRKSTPKLAISVLSGRPELVSGDSALVRIDAPTQGLANGLKITIGKRSVKSAFISRGGGRLEGLVAGLKPGPNTIKAIFRKRYGAQLTLVDHPDSGPVLSGPQLQPWSCQAGARNAQCEQDPSYAYKYKSTDATKSGFQPYDPANPPSDVAQTTADNGTKVPFVVRVETGYMDRDQYQIAALYQPGKPWTALDPQPQFDHKLLITHGASCGDDRTTGTAPDTIGDAAGADALGKGYVVMSTALDNSGHNCNVALQAESLIMAKARIITRYGTLRYTIGTGCSGGSLAEQWIANAYPGVYQGILPTCSFPDAWSTATQFLDYHVLLQYFTDSSKWGAGVAWLPTQEADVLGGPDGVVNAEVSENAQFHVAVPTDTCSGISDAQRYSASNPGGTRCAIQDAAINVFGPEPASLWSAAEKQLGHGFVRPPIDNVGVQYGLSSLKSGAITPAQFADLNAALQAVDIDVVSTGPGRVDGSSPALARAYRSGMINDANELDQVAIIDCRGPNPGLFHDAYRAFAVRARLDREHGTHANQVIWEGPTPILGDASCEDNSFRAMDGWLAKVESDTGNASLAKKIIADKPAEIRDRCYDGAGQKLSDGLCPRGVVPIEGTPRTVAGDAITTDDNKCQLKPLDRGSYGVAFTDADWAKLQAVFPNGVCDFSKPGVDQQPTVPWLTYQDAKGAVVYGGKPLGPVPAAKQIRVRAKARG